MGRRLGDDVIFEFLPNGAYCKVCAVDPVTGIEAVIVGASATGQYQLKLIALKKLQMLIDKLEASEPTKADKKPASRPGSIVV